MKRTMAWACAAVLLLVSCAEKEQDILSGTDGLFARVEGLATRTSYDGVGTVGDFQWSTGDKIAIHTEAPSFVSAAVNPSDGAVAYTASIEDKRDYYAVYPDGVADASNYGNPNLKVTLPAEYDIQSTMTTDFAPMPMVAVNDPDDSYLQFYHVGGLLRIFCNEGIPAGVKTVTVTMDKGVTGSFTVSNPATATPTIQAAALSSSNSTVTFIIAGASGLATDRSDIILNIPLPCGTYNSLGLNYYDKDGNQVSSLGYSNPFTLGRHEGLMLWTGSSFDRYTFTGVQPSELSTAGGVSLEGSITSYRTNFLGGQQIVGWTIDGFFSDAACSTPVSKPAWISDVTDAGAGSASYEPVEVTYLPSTYTRVETSTIQNAVNNTISAKGVIGSTSSYKNLSNPTSMDSNTIAESANSYIVNAQGYYRIPLVMGNGVKNNAVNPVAKTYQGAAEASPDNGMIRFRDYKGNPITSPYLHSSSTGVGTPTSAFVVWEDVDGLIEASGYDLPAGCITSAGGVYWLNFHVARPEQGNAVIAVCDQGETVMWSYHIWVTDYVPKNYPDYASSSKKDVAVRSSYSNTSAARFNMMPNNLGWVIYSGDQTYNYPKDEVYARFRQDGSGNTVVLKLWRGAKSVTRKLGYHSPFFQWGRKDAFWPGYGVNNVNTAWFGKYPGASGYSIGTATLATAITHPQYIYGRQDLTYWAASKLAYNIWNANRTNHAADIAVLKTIYDPSPAGYHVPPQQAYRGFTKDGGNADQTNPENINGTAKWETIGGVESMYWELNTNLGSTMRFYAQGSRNWGAGVGQPVGFIWYEHNNGALWTADPALIESNLYSIYFDYSYPKGGTTFYVMTDHTFERNYVFSIRPVQD